MRQPRGPPNWSGPVIRTYDTLGDVTTVADLSHPPSLRVPSVSSWRPTAVAQLAIPVTINRFASLIPLIRVNHALGARAGSIRDHGLDNTAVTASLMVGFGALK